jgi:hypothetical protein
VTVDPNLILVTNSSENFAGFLKSAARWNSMKVGSEGASVPQMLSGRVETRVSGGRKMDLHPADNIVARALIPLLTPLSGSDEPQCAGRSRLPGDESKECAPSSPEGNKTCSQVIVHERPSHATLSVTWSDPTLGHVVCQVWRRGVSQIDAFCALTGVPISRGDSIFRPRPRESHFPS